MNDNSIVFSVLFTVLICFTYTAVSISQLSAKTIRCHPDDKKALLEIKAALGNPYVLVSSDPNNTSEPDCCDWYALACDINPPYRVTSFAIMDADISGQISEAIGDLTYLQHLVFYNVTNLTGTIPPSITKLDNLGNFVIRYAKLSGPIPTYLNKLKNLFLLDLSYNDFTGSIPESFGDFAGSIPSIYLSHNHLTGTIPESLGNTISFLDLSRNNLIGDVSSLFGKNKTILYLDLSRNNLTFDLSNVEFPSSLSTLNLNHNKIFGSLPQQLTQLQQLSSLNVSYNRLCGEIPQGGYLQHLGVSSYFHNRCLCGAPLPPCTTRLPNQIAN